MATLVPMNTPARQPLGFLNESKLRSMQSVKNRQNAILTSHSAPSLKRRAVSPEEGSDSENIDPNIIDSLHKRKRSTLEDDVSVSKFNRYSLSLNTLPSTRRRLNNPVVSPTPRLDTFIKPSTSTPASAPAAGRSPTRKRSGPLQSRKRFNPPPFSLNAPSPALSLSAALSGTKKSRQLSHKTQPQTIGTIEDSKPKSWFFDIFEESLEAQEYRMNEWTMTQSATGLDISDDEGKAKSSERLDRGKENVDPNEVSVPVTRSMAAAARVEMRASKEKDVNAMTDKEERAPLANLNPAEFYAEGLDATSVVLVHDDSDTDTVALEDETDTMTEHHDFTFQASTSTSLSQSKAIDALGAPSISEILSSAAPHPFPPAINMNHDADETLVAAPFTKAETPEVEIEIWESESAKDENEKHELQHDVGSPGSIGDETVFALQEL
ncbi:uncharacterized protein Z518_00163 [Rhinocladiella mackenziei CBS 650.93]|uniref:Uncharacterized protein n=1 Tax=Rhinocladiella mackenziei CBS 650.93 TaxID=1442369 RepID=A0A0D2JI89_9EURO|nr:uncharacterized protein Z518_00163 [Rhinocladiella mackenziei CBS 650.93]KIX09085.1 hypothetical protein Z518_00163 [Rhinocladiella mackenziei CBS 650.93]